jgi:hypothetical protein
MTASVQKTLAQSWLLLVHQLPAQPAYLRVKVWRRLQALGAIPIKNAVHALPMNEGTQEDFEWLLREIGQGGGGAVLCEARLIDGISDEEVRRLFDQARDADYDEITKEALAAAKSLRPKLKPEAINDLRSQIARLRKRLADVVSIDFFGAIGRQKAEGAIATLEARLNEDDTVKQKATDQPKTDAMRDLIGKTWVTRQGVHIDRIASAWLIRRFIDPEAQFKFVSGKGYRSQPNELRFDMFEAEFTHEGDKCTFEVLLDRVGLKDSALQAISEIIHDVDLKDNKFGREEAAGIRTLIDGIAVTTTEDSQRIDRGTSVFNDLYEYFRRKRR